MWLSLGGLFPSLHKRNDTPVFSVKWTQGDQELGSDWITENPLGFPTLPPALVVAFNFGGCPTSSSA